MEDNNSGNSAKLLQRKLLSALNNKDLPLFKELLQSGNTNDAGYSHLLVACCKVSWGAEFVRALLKSGADPNTASDFFEIPIHAAAGKGNYETVEVLLSDERTHAHIKDSFERTALHLATINSNPIDPECEKYYKCISVLLNWSGINNNDENSVEEHHLLLQPLHLIDINAMDWLGNTALHYSVKNADQKAIMLLLRNNASISLHNDKGILPIDGIAADTLEAYLDDCVRDVENHGFIFHYKFLFSHQPTCISDAMLPTSDNILFCHPYSEQKKIYTFLPEMNSIKHIAESLDLKHLIKHPVISGFVYLKWRKFCLFYFLNLLFYILVAAVLTSWVFISSELIKYSDNTFKPELFLAKRVLCGFLMFFTVALIFGQLFVIRASQSLLNYVIRFPNNLEANLTINLIIIVMAEVASINVDVKLATAITVIFSWLIILVKSGQHTVLSPCFYILKSYCKIIVKYIAWLSLLAVGISVSIFFLICNSNIPTFQAFFLETRNIIFFVLSCIITLIVLNTLIGVAVNEVTCADKEFIQIYTSITLLFEMENLLLGNPSSLYLQLRKLRINTNQLLSRYVRFSLCTWNAGNICRWFPTLAKRIILFPETTSMKKLFSPFSERNILKSNKLFLKSIENVMWKKQKSRIEDCKTKGSVCYEEKVDKLSEWIHHTESQLKQINETQQQILSLLTRKHVNLDESFA